MTSNYNKKDRCQQLFNHYLNEHPDFFNNHLIRNFLSHKENNILLKKTICNPSKENQTQLDHAFKNFYFNIRFTSYISSALYFNAINYDKKYRKIRNRHVLLIDKPIGDSENDTFKDLICDTQAEIKLDHMMKSDSICDYIENPLLFKALKTLTNKQIEIINLAYINGLSDTEIAITLNKSQQSVSKTHKKAIQNIYCFLNERRLKHDCDRSSSTHLHFG